MSCRNRKAKNGSLNEKTNLFFLSPSINWHQKHVSYSQHQLTFSFGLPLPISIYYFCQMTSNYTFPRNTWKIKPFFDMSNIKTSWELLIKYLWSISAKQTNFYIMEQKHKTLILSDHNSSKLIALILKRKNFFFIMEKTTTSLKSLNFYLKFSTLSRLY